MNQSVTSPGGELCATEIRPWGSITLLTAQAHFKTRQLTINPGHRLSLQLHHHRHETFTVVQGAAKITLEEREYLLQTGQTTACPAGTRYRIENVGVIRLVLIETVTGEYLGEDDIIRFQDDYGRSLR